MGCSKCVVYENIGKGSKLGRKRIHIFCFFRTVTRVFQKHNVAVFHVGNGFFRIFANHIVVSGKNHLFAQLFRQAFCNGSQR